MPSVSPIVLIASCELFRRNGVNAAARNTWIQQWGEAVSYRFLLGRGCQQPADDELVLDVDDSYAGLTNKVQAARRWASESGFEYSFHCGADTYVVVPRLLASGYEQSDYSGFLIHDEHRIYAPRNIQFAQGGGGYFLSLRAASVVENAPIPNWVGKAEDVFVADALFNAGIKPTHDVGYWTWGYRSETDPPTLEGGPFIGCASAITVHLSAYWRRPTYDTAWMYDMHRRVLDTGDVWERKHAAAPEPDVK